MKEKIIITSSDDKYFHLVEELYNSIKFHNLEKSFDFGIIDTGISKKQIEKFKNEDIIFKNGEWNVDVPSFKVRGRNHLKNIVARAFLPDYFQGYKKYIWLDADTWINHKNTFLFFDKGCTQDKICITPQVDRSYGKLAKVEWFLNFPKRIKTINFKNISRSVSKSLGKKYAMHPTLNGGVFSINSNSKIWKTFQKNIKLALKKGRIFGSDQVALALSIYEDGIDPEYLPAYTNYMCEFKYPFFDQENLLFVEPYLPFHPIGVMHLAGLDLLREKENKLIKLKNLKGENINKSLRFI